MRKMWVVVAAVVVAVVAVVVVFAHPWRSDDAPQGGVGPAPSMSASTEPPASTHPTAAVSAPNLYLAIGVAEQFVSAYNAFDYSVGFPGWKASYYTDPSTGKSIVGGELKTEIDQMIANAKDPSNGDEKYFQSLASIHRVDRIVVTDRQTYPQPNGDVFVVISWYKSAHSDTGDGRGTPQSSMITVRSVHGTYLAISDDPAQSP